MRSYYHHVNYHHRARIYRRIKVLVLTVIGCALVAGLIVLIDNLIQTKKSNTPSPTSQSGASSFSNQIEVFATQYFRFQADNSWINIASESTPNSFKYLSSRGPLVEHELTIYVDTTSPTFEATRVIPVAQNNSVLVPEATSEHCKEAAPSLKNPGLIRSNGVDFICNPDSSSYHVAVGIKNGNTVMRLQRPDGSFLNYTIHYKNLTAMPDDLQIQNILKSFEIR
jgi:hypothetical protein